VRGALNTHRAAPNPEALGYSSFPIGQVTTLVYGLAADIFKITKVTDPFGRSARFSYDSSHRLIEITDVIGLTSEFTYDASTSSDFIVHLKTPYGITSFTKPHPAHARPWRVGTICEQRQLTETGPLACAPRAKLATTNS
jgi:YD repeat-containing protein